MSKTYFSLFANNGEKADSNKFRKYKGKDASGKAEFDEVTADYRVTNTESTVSGSAIRDKSQAGHNVIRTKLEVKEDDSSTTYYGTLNLTKQKLTVNSPDMFGTASTKDGTEMDLACWFKDDKNGDKYLSCNLQEPFQKTDDASTMAQAPASTDMDDYSDIPF